MEHWEWIHIMADWSAFNDVHLYWSRSAYHTSKQHLNQAPTCEQDTPLQIKSHFNGILNDKYFQNHIKI